MAASLTQNAILALTNGDVDLDPVLQILDVRQVGSGKSTQERYRVLLSDGVYVQPAFLVTRLNQFAQSGQVQRGSIVKLIKYICDTVQNRKIIMVLSMEVVVSDAEIIGDPQQVTMNTSNLQQLQQTPEDFQGPGHGFEVNAQAFGGGRTPSNCPPSTHAHRVTASPSQPAPLYSNPRPSPSQPAPLYSNPRPKFKNLAPAPIVPIAALNPFRERWTIKARVTAKEELQRYKNAKTEGKFFHFGLVDAEGDEIRVKCFNDVADNFFDRIEVAKVYMLSKASLKPAQRPFNHLKNDWEIHMENASMLEPCYEGDGSIPLQMFDFTTIREIEHMEANSVVDLLGVVVTVKPTARIMPKSGTETQKQSLQLLDMSGRSVEVTLWGTFCNNQGQQLQELRDSGQFPVLALKAGRISNFNAKSVVTIPLSQLVVEPNLSQAFEVKEWFERVWLQSISKAGGAGACGAADKIRDGGLGDPFYNGYDGSTPARISPTGPLGGKGRVELESPKMGMTAGRKTGLNHVLMKEGRVNQVVTQAGDRGFNAGGVKGYQVRAKSAQPRITSFFNGIVKKSSLKRPRTSTTMDIRSKPTSMEERATQRPPIIWDH